MFSNKEEEIQRLKEDIAILQEKLNKLEEIEKHKSQPKMKFLFDGKFEVVSYNKKSYYRFEFPDEIYWYRRTSHETYLDLKLERITDGETHRLLEGLWFNDVRKGKYDEPYCPDEPEYYDEVEWDEKDNPNLQKVIDEMVEEHKSQTLYEIIRGWYEDRDCPTCEELLNRIEKWLPKEQSSKGSQNAYVECSVEGFNDCLTKIKGMLR